MRVPELYKAFPGACCFMNADDARKRGLNQGAEVTDHLAPGGNQVAA